MSRITTDLERERVLQRSRHDVLVKLEQAIEGGRELRGALVVGHDVEERRQGVQRAGRHHDDIYAVLRGAGRRRAVERRRQGAPFGRSLDSFALF